MTRYHHAPHTLDPAQPIEDDAPPSAGHDQDAAEAVREAHEQAEQDAKDAAEAQAKADEEWAERDPKPTPSQLLQERGTEPTPESGAEGDAGEASDSDPKA